MKKKLRTRMTTAYLPRSLNLFMYSSLCSSTRNGSMKSEFTISIRYLDSTDPPMAMKTKSKSVRSAIAMTTGAPPQKLRADQGRSGRIRAL